MATGETTYFRIFGDILLIFRRLESVMRVWLMLNTHFSLDGTTALAGPRRMGKLGSSSRLSRPKWFFCHGFHISILGDSQESLEPNALPCMNFRNPIGSLEEVPWKVRRSFSLMHRQAFFFACFDLLQEHVLLLAGNICNAHSGDGC